jgi:hypothetical protein
MDSRIDNPGDSIHHVLAYLDGPENTSVKEYCDIHGCAHGTILARMSKLRKKARELAGIPPPGLNVAQTARLLSKDNNGPPKDHNDHHHMQAARQRSTGMTSVGNSLEDHRAHDDTVLQFFLHSDPDEFKTAKAFAEKEKIQYRTFLHMVNSFKSRVGDSPEWMENMSPAQKHRYHGAKDGAARRNDLVREYFECKYETTMKKFAEDRGISVNTFGCWISAFRKEQAKKISDVGGWTSDGISTTADGTKNGRLAAAAHTRVDGTAASGGSMMMTLNGDEDGPRLYKWTPKEERNRKACEYLQMASKMTMNAFCEQNDIKYKKFSTWITEYKKTLGEDELIVTNDGKQSRRQLMGDKLALVQQYINVQDSIPLKQFTVENEVAYGTFYGWLQFYKKCKDI